jgi:hypothetical protein
MGKGLWDFLSKSFSHRMDEGGRGDQGRGVGERGDGKGPWHFLRRIVFDSLCASPLGVCPYIRVRNYGRRNTRPARPESSKAQGFQVQTLKPGHTIHYSDFKDASV